jgi:hypothetical protein
MKRRIPFDRETMFRNQHNVPTVCGIHRGNVGGWDRTIG